jgi:parallel beta-helix repeat protein
MRRTIVSLTTMALTLLVASGVVLAAGIGSAGAQGSVVGPGESIQKAINAADPGDTIVVRGVHREDVVIRKNGIELRGDDATLKPPARAGSPCSKAVGPEGICILGDVDPEAGEVNEYVKDVRVSGFTVKGFDEAAIETVGASNATITGNRAVGSGETGIGNFLSVGTKILANVTRGPGGTGIGLAEATNTLISGNNLSGHDFVGIFVIDSPGTKILSNDITDSTVVGTVILDSTGTKIVSNDISRSGDSGISISGPERANNDAKVVGNNISGGPAGIYVADAHGGSFTGNQVHDNCAGMFFEADGFKDPVSGFEVKGNTVENNARSCRPAGFERNVSGVGIALLGTTDMEVTGNHLSGNVPSGPTAVSGGVVVSTDPFFGGSAKLRNNSVIGNHFGRNKPDIFWDESGSGNRFIGNLCNSSVPSRLCN